MIVEFLSALEHVSQGGKQTLRSPDKVRDWIDELFAITRLVPFDWRTDRRYDIVGSAVPREEDFDARARSLRCLDEDEFMFVRNNHRRRLSNNK